MDLSDDEYLTGSDMEIDPALARKLHRVGDEDYSDFDEDYPEPIQFSDDEELGHDDLDDGLSFRDRLKHASGFKVRHRRKDATKTAKNYRRRMLRSTDKADDPEVRDHIAKANAAFVQNDLSTAYEHYREVVQLDPRNYVAYKTLGEISHMKGNINKCCAYWFLAASCRERDVEGWVQVAELSVRLGHVDQAVLCYNHAIANLDGPNADLLLERAQLYRRKRQYGRALEGYQRVHQLRPEDPTYIKLLASVYQEQKRLNDAVNLYMRVLDANLYPQPGVRYPRFNWSELNILLELLAPLRSWSMGPRLIKMVARWKQDRQDENALWDEHDDSEFDEARRRKALYTKKPSIHASYMERDYHLPIDIRFKLGQFRLELGQKDEALHHFGYLLKEADDDVNDLFFEAGCSLEAKGYFQDAALYLSHLGPIEENLEMGRLLGKCYVEVKDFANAIDVLLTVQQHDPDNHDVLLDLAEAYYWTDEREKAGKILQEIREQAATKEVSEEQVGEPEQIQEEWALIGDNALDKNVRTSKALTEEERKKIEEAATRRVTTKFNRMQRLEEEIKQGHHVAAAAWMKLASQLIEMFMEVRSFFPKNRKTTFKGIVMYKRKKSISIDDRLDRLYNLYDGITESDNSRMEMTSQTEFRGLSYDTWLYVFVQYAFLLRNFENNIDEAVQVLEVALDVSVFVQDETKITLLRLARLAFGIFQGDFATTVSNNVRPFLTSTQFSPAIYDFFMCCFSSGVSAWAAFSNYNHQKFFLRHLKAYDSLLTSTKVSGSAQVTIDVKDFAFTREHPQLLYIYACLLGSNRSFSSPIVYLTRAYRQYYNDPTICFTLGLAHVHRSMQRNTNNRHIQLLQGISYLMEYKDAREKNATIYEKQEIEYNFGRMFHMIGLPTLAVKHYNRVLSYHDEMKEDPTYDMLMEAAYNLTLIYTISGNSEMSRRISEQYLTI